MLTQYKSHSLDRHISLTWRMSTMLGNYVTPVPAQQRLGPQWYLGSADAIYQSINLIYDERPDIIVVFGADHVYRMDASQMVRAHIESGAGVTVAGIRVPRKEAWQFGVIKTGADGLHDRRVPGEAGRPARAAGLTRRVVRLDGQLRLHRRRARRGARAGRRGPRLRHDMGGDIIPMLVEQRQGRASTTSSDNVVPGATDRDRDYWRDVGTIDSYHEAHLDLVSVEPVFNLYNSRLADLHLAPAAARREVREGGYARDSIVCRRVDRVRAPTSTAR